MTEFILLPRLNPLVASDLRKRLLSEDQLYAEFAEARFAEVIEDPRSFAATGGRRITNEELLEFRSQCDSAVALAAKSPSVGFGQTLDLALGRLFLEFGRKSTSEMGHPQVWDFLTLVLLPDVATQRIMVGRRSNEAIGSSATGRLTGGDRRHVFQRLWKRWRVFGADWVESRLLTEDDYLAMLERSLTLEQSLVARRAADTIVNSTLTGSARREYARILMRNLIAVSGVAHVGEDDPAHLDAVFAHVHAQTWAMV